MMDHIKGINEMVSDGLNRSRYPSSEFSENVLRGLVDLSHRVCGYLVRVNEKGSSLIVNYILRMIAGIIEKQYTYITSEVSKQVIVEVQEYKLKLEVARRQYRELDSKLSEVVAEHEAEMKVMRQKISKLAEEKNSH